MPGTESTLLVALPRGDQILAIFVWFLVAAGVTLGGLAVALAVRRWTQREQTTVTFTMQDLREMRARGLITDREFAAMRAAILAQQDAAGPGNALPDAGPSAPERPDPPRA